MDTTSPQFMTNTIKAVYSQKLDKWLRGAKTGKNRLKSGLPSDWALAHKTGSCKDGPSNDVGVIYPSKGKPIYISVFVDGAETSFEEREKAHREIAKVIAKFYSEH